jgi:hypothetical protein
VDNLTLLEGGYITLSATAAAASLFFCCLSLSRRAASKNAKSNWTSALLAGILEVIVSYFETVVAAGASTSL